MLLEIGIGNLHRPGDSCRDAIGEPAAKRVIDDKQRKQRGDHRRQRGDPAKQQRKAPVKLIAGHFLAAFGQ